MSNPVNARWVGAAAELVAVAGFFFAVELDTPELCFGVGLCPGGGLCGGVGLCPGGGGVGLRAGVELCGGTVCDVVVPWV